MPSPKIGPRQGWVRQRAELASCWKRGRYANRAGGDGRRLDSTSILGGKSFPAKVRTPKEDMKQKNLISEWNIQMVGAKYMIIWPSYHLSHGKLYKMAFPSFPLCRSCTHPKNHWRWLASTLELYFLTILLPFEKLTPTYSTGKHHVKLFHVLPCVLLQNA